MTTVRKFVWLAVLIYGLVMNPALSNAKSVMYLQAKRVDLATAAGFMRGPVKAYYLYHVPLQAPKRQGDSAFIKQPREQ